MRIQPCGLIYDLFLLSGLTINTITLELSLPLGRQKHLTCHYHRRNNRIPNPACTWTLQLSYNLPHRYFIWLLYLFSQFSSTLKPLKVNQCDKIIPESSMCHLSCGLPEPFSMQNALLYGVVCLCLTRSWLHLSWQERNLSVTDTEQAEEWSWCLSQCWGSRLMAWVEWLLPAPV